MAHNLATIGGKIAMCYQGETPWHQLGTVMPSGLVSVPDALIAASLDWNVALEPMFLQDGTQVPKRLAVRRDSDKAVLSTVSDWYEPIQYRDAFSIFQPAVEEFGLTVEAAGALGSGERAWMLFRLPVTVSPVPGDDVNGYGLAVTGHDGKTSFDFRPTPIRVVCQNTLDAAVGVNIHGQASAKGRLFNVQHIGDVKTAIDEARRAVKGVLNTMKETGDTFAAMAKREMTAEEVAGYIEGIFPSERDGKVTDKTAERRQIIAELLFKGQGAALALSATDGNPNAWAIYNAVTEYFDHVSTGLTKSANFRRIKNQSAVFGDGADIKLLALRRAQQLVAA